MVYGQGGVSRFAVTPKVVTTGGNFGFTNFIMALHRAKERGRLQPHVAGLYRHTAGGPDNLCQVTHLLHWLLIYVGCFQSLIWFRFEAGHSHTELADRLFSPSSSGCLQLVQRCSTARVQRQASRPRRLGIRRPGRPTTVLYTAAARPARDLADQQVQWFEQDL